MQNSITDRLAGFDAYIAAEIEKYQVPGLAVAIVHKGKIELCQGYGLRDIAQNLPVTPETLFAIGSCSKAFTAMGIGMLVDEGVLNWDTPVRNYLPAFKLRDPAASEGLTLRDLLCHRSGLPRHDHVWYGSKLSRQELFERLQYLQPNKPLRYLYQYNNLLFMTAGYLVGEMAGMSWENFTQARILDKLGMGSTQFSVEDSKKSANAALPYALRDGQVIAIPYSNLDAIAPAGAINSNLIDMLPWLQMHMRGGTHNGKALIKADMLKEMHTQQMVMPLVPDMPGYGYTEIQRVCYGLGWRIQTYRGRELVWHTGGIHGFIAMVSFMPGEDVGVIVYGNQGDTFLPITVTLNIYDRIFGQDVIPWSQRLKAKEDLGEQDIKKELAQRSAERKPGTSTSHPLADYVGEYHHPAYETLTITRDGDHLSAVRNGMEFTLTHYHYDTFEASNPTMPFMPLVSFFNDDAGDVHQFALPIEPLADPIMFTRVNASA